VPLGTNLLDRPGFTFRDFAFEFGQKRHTATAWKEIALDLLISRFLFQLFEPVGKLFTFGFGEADDGFLDGFHGHTHVLFVRRRIN